MVKKIVIDKDIPILDRSVACIGYFDGIHLGHKKLITRTINDALKLNIKSSLICFEPDPTEIIQGVRNKHLLSNSNRNSYLEYLGIDQIIIIKFNEELMKLSPSKFIKIYLENLNIVELICGYDFSFGYKAKGNIDLLQKNSKFKTIVIDEYKIGNKKVSTSRIKQELIKGNFKLVNRLLGYNYCTIVKVTNCSKIGKKYLVEAKMKDKNAIIPENYRYSDDLYIESSKIYIQGNKKLEKGQEILIDFE